MSIFEKRSTDKFGRTKSHDKGNKLGKVVDIFRCKLRRLNFIWESLEAFEHKHGKIEPFLMKMNLAAMYRMSCCNKR